MINFDEFDTEEQSKYDDIYAWYLDYFTRNHELYVVFVDTVERKLKYYWEYRLIGTPHHTSEPYEPENAHSFASYLRDNNGKFFHELTYLFDEYFLIKTGLEKPNTDEIKITYERMVNKITDNPPPPLRTLGL